MKKQIRRSSPHQNGKVFAILSAVSSLVFVIPMFLLMSFLPQVNQHGNEASPPLFFFLLMPLFYLVFTYIFVAIGCVVYNFLVKYIGGIEFELENQDA